MYNRALAGGTSHCPCAVGLSQCCSPTFFSGGEGIPDLGDIGFTFPGGKGVPRLLRRLRDLKQKSPTLSNRAMVLGDDLLSHL